MPQLKGHSNRCVELPVASQSDVRVLTGVHNLTVSPTAEGGVKLGFYLRTVELSSKVVVIAKQPSEETNSSSPGVKSHAVTITLGSRPLNPE